MKKLTVLHVANLDDDKSKGPNTNVPKNIIYGNKYDNVGLYNLQHRKLAIEIPKDKYFDSAKYNSIDELPTPFNRPDIVVFHGVYFARYCKIAKWLNKNKVPYIVVPRCSMTTPAIKSHALKKKLANILLFNRFIKKAKKIQFLTMNEYEESKNNFKFKDYFILGNGIEIPKKHYAVKTRENFKIVFIGRYNIYHKGLDILLDAIANNKSWFEKNKVLVLLYGSDSDGGLKKLEERITEDKLEKVVKICGSVFEKEKENALLDADIFIHTSRLEGQPTAVIEAISYGIPVIVTPGTNVADIVEKEKLGYTTEFEPQSIFGCIKKAFISKPDYAQISKSATEYAKKSLVWDTIIKMARKEYLD